MELRRRASLTHDFSEGTLYLTTPIDGKDFLLANDLKERKGKEKMESGPR